MDIILSFGLAGFIVYWFYLRAENYTDNRSVAPYKIEPPAAEIKPTETLLGEPDPTTSTLLGSSTKVKMPKVARVKKSKLL